MRKFICTISLILSVLALFSCESEFVKDPIDPRLPKYTEVGNNVAGAFINQNTWRSEVMCDFSVGGIIAVNEPYITVNKGNDSTNIQFFGKFKGDHMEIVFNLKGLKLGSFKDLKLLKDKKIELDGKRNFGLYYNESVASKIPISLKGETGQLYFRNVSLKDSSSAVISGTFGFAYTDSANATTKVSYGRFDYKIRNDEDFIIK